MIQRYYPITVCGFKAAPDNITGDYWCRAADVTKLEADHVSREKLKALVETWKSFTTRTIQLPMAIADLEKLL